MRVSFGKYRGQEWADVPIGYLNWCDQNLKGPIRGPVTIELRRRVAQRGVRLAAEPPKEKVSAEQHQRNVENAKKMLLELLRQ